MIIVGLTGGIGSGKTSVAKQFQALGIPIYIADDEAKKLMNASKVIRRKLIGLFGENAYLNNELNRPYIAKVIYNDKTYLEKMNAIVHPKVASHFIKWAKKQVAPYVIKESAILFETGGDKKCQFTILVVAPENVKIERLKKRDSTTKQKIQAIMRNQLTDDEKIKKANFVIENVLLENTVNQVNTIHSAILKKTLEP